VISETVQKTIGKLKYRREDFMKNNPFNPSVGIIPPVFIDREQVVEEVFEGLTNMDGPM